MGWSQEDIAKAFNFKSVDSFRGASKRKIYMEGLDRLIGESFGKGLVVPVERLKDVFEQVLVEIEKG
jgi:hypothetical protein